MGMFHDCNENDVVKERKDELMELVNGMNRSAGCSIPRWVCFLISSFWSET